MPSIHKRIRHPYHLKKLYAVWRIRLLAHPHTGKRAHHQHTSYALLGLVLLGVGAVLARSTLDTFAATTDSFNVTVSAKVLGQPPASAATINTPAEAKDFAAAPITVSGTCPASTYVGLYRNNYPSGTALCNGGMYTIQTDLFEGSNRLVARVFNYADQPGPDSDPVTVSYTLPVVVDPPIPPIQGTGGTAPSNPSRPAGSNNPGGSAGSGTKKPDTAAPARPLVLRNDYHIQGYAVGENASWQVAIMGGTAPYSINVAWGDGTSALYTSENADTLTLTHAYAKPGPADGSYAVVVSASDAAGNRTSLQILALINEPEQSGGAAGASSNGGPLKIFGFSVLQAIGYMWSLYGILCIILLAFWLGERRELGQIRSKFRLTKL